MMMTRHRWQTPLLAAALAAMAVLWHAAAGEAAQEKKAQGGEAVPAGAKHATIGTSRAPYVHHVLLHDEEGNKINPAAEWTPPFSTGNTCGHCHDYPTVSGGWHFSAWDPQAAPGRPGEPWFVAKRKVGVQMPVSERPWTGVFSPKDAGISPWAFVQRFGPNFPGGGIGEKFADGGKDTDPKARWDVSGKLEINCLGCHDMEPGHDQTQWGVQLTEQNLAWATASTTGFATVKGAARRMSKMWDRTKQPEDEDKKKAPSAKYDVARFDGQNRVLMQLKREPDAGRCYFCHSTTEVESDAPRRWQADQDVHLTAGMKCTSCHRNGLDHKITRGYEGEECGAAFTCAGCHYGGGGARENVEQAKVLAGRFGAPRPQHRGLPNFHFERLACAACHSGPLPDKKAVRVQLSRSHLLEYAGGHRSDDAAPYIFEPVFMPDSNGKIAPHKVAWSSYWARVKDGKMQVLDADKVADAAGDLLEAAPAGGDAPKPDAKPLNAEKVTKILQALAKNAADGAPVYVSGGMVYSPDGSYKPADDATKWYAWPVAHNVRPAQQALGAGGCTDCHSKGAYFFHGEVPVESFMAESRPPIAMSSLVGMEEPELTVWELSFIFRTPFVAFCVVACVVVGAVLLYYLMRGLGGFSRLWR